MTRVLVVSSIFPNNVEINKGIYIYNLVRELSRICEVKVVAPVPYVPWFLKKGKRYGSLAQIRKHEEIEGLEVFHPSVLLIPKTGRSLYGLLYAFSLFRKIRELKRSFQPDVILNYWAYPDGFASVLIGKALRLPVVVGGRGCDVNNVEMFTIRKMVSWALRESDRLFAVSAAMKMRMKELGASEERICVIPNGISDRFKPMDPRESRKATNLSDGEKQRKIILYCGRFSPEKGIEYLLEAAKLLSDKGESFLLLMVGEGEQKRQIMDLIDHMGLHRCVEVRESVPHDKIPALMNSADVLCLPSIREGWPNVVVEALACGVPVVASNVGGVPEILTSPDYGIMVPKEDSRALAEGLSAAIHKKWEKEKIREGVIDRTWERVACEVYKEIGRAVP